MKKIVIITLVIAFIASCSKHPVLPDSGSVKLNVNYEVDGSSLLFDTIRYENAAGNQYSVTRLMYYLSHFEFHREDGTSYLDENYFYLNAKAPKSLVVDNIPPGNYSGVSFYFGLPEELNTTGSLSPTTENMNMAWPDPMGGGYHFLKFEGHYIEGDSTNGYAIHMGKNNARFEVKLDYDFEIKYKNEKLELIMNLNEWFHNPTIYNLSTDGNYTMSSDSLISIFKENGVSVFRFSY